MEIIVRVISPERVPIGKGYSPGCRPNKATIHPAAGPVRTTIYPAAGLIRACSPDRRVNKDLFTRQPGQKYAIHPAEVIKLRHTAVGKMHIL